VFSDLTKVIVIDSIQTMVTDGSTSAPGSVTQVRDCAAQLNHLTCTNEHDGLLR
jgi:predicted ATP-dependent serine protease